MADKILKTRIKLLTKSYSEWQEIKDTFVPLLGELCVVNVPVESGAVVNEPALLFKVGDGEHTFAELGFTSALAADVYTWAKKEKLDWADLDAAFLAKLDERINEEAPQQDTQYQIVSDGEFAWKLQKSIDNGETWVDATGRIDIANKVAELEAAIQQNADDIAALDTNLRAEIAKKTDKEVTGANGKALVFNESDGGGAKFEHKDGTFSFVGVNDGGKDGLAGQLYTVDSTTKVGARLNMTKDGFFYTTGKNTYTYTADDELVTKKDIKGIEGGMHYIGNTTTQEGETVEQAIARLLQEKGHTAEAGDIVIINSKEVIYDGESWGEVGDEDNYATKAALEAEAEAREQAIVDEVTAREEADQALSERLSEAEEAIGEAATPREPVYDETLKILFANGVPITISDSGTDNLITYYGEGSKAYIPNEVHIPYNAIVIGGGDGREKGQYFPASSIVINGGQLQRVFGGSYAAGSVGTTTVIMNGGTVSKGLHGGSMKGVSTAVHAGSVGHAKVILNGGRCESVLSAGGIDMTDTGYSELTINGGFAKYCYGSGANGTFGASDVYVTGGEITYLLGTVRGATQNVKYHITGGQIANMYAGADYDAEDFGTIKNCYIEALGGTITSLRIGTSNKVAGDLNCSGIYAHGVITNETEAVAECNLSIKEVVDGYSNKLSDMVSQYDQLILDCNL